jgi:flagellar motor protein MotB
VIVTLWGFRVTIEVTGHTDNVTISTVTPQDRALNQRGPALLWG